MELRAEMWRFIQQWSAKDAQVEREIHQRLIEIARREHDLQQQRWARQRAHIEKAMEPSYQKATRALWRSATEPLVTPETALHLEEWYAR